jgi:hypothetical protein
MANWKTESEAMKVNCPHLGKCMASQCGVWVERECTGCEGKGTVGKVYDGNQTGVRICPVCKGSGSDGTGYGRCGNSKK